MRERDWYLLGGIVVVVLAAWLWLGTALLWIGGALFSLAALAGAFKVWGWLRAGVDQSRALHVESLIAQAEAQAAQAHAEKARAEADQARAQAAQAWQLVKAIPANYIGVRLEQPEQAALYHVWPQPSSITNNYAGASALPAPNALVARRPLAESFWSIREQVGSDHFYLGNIIDAEGKQRQLWAPLSTILTMVAIGPQGVGKSTLIRSLALQQAMQGGDLHIIDWYNDLAAEMGRYFPHCYTLADQIEQYAECILLPELEARRLAYGAGQREFRALYLAIDEWLELQPDCPAMAEALRRCFSIGRKIGIRLGLSSVALEAKQLGISKSVPSAVALFTPNRNVAAQWGLYGADVDAELKKLYDAGRGYCVISSLLLGQRAALLALPDVSPQVFTETLQTTRPDLQQRCVEQGNAFPPSLKRPVPPLEPLPEKGGKAPAYL